MFDFYGDDLSNMSSIQFSVFAKAGEKPLEQLDRNKYDVFLISNSIYFSYQESQQLMKKVDRIPASLLIKKVLHYSPHVETASGASYLDAKEGNSQISTSSLFLVIEKDSMKFVISAFKKLGFLINRVRAEEFSKITVLQPLDVHSLIVDCK